MAQIDLKKVNFFVVDGKLASLAIGGGASEVLYTDVSHHNGTRAPIQVAHINPGGTVALSVAVAVANGISTINVTLGTSGGSIISTAAQVATAVNAYGPAVALVVATTPNSGGSGTAVAAAAASTTGGANSFQIKIGSGNMVWSEPTENRYTLDRGLIDTVQTGDEMPIDLTIDAELSHFTGVPLSGIPTIEDTIKQRGPASSWVSTNTSPDTGGYDSCGPYTIDFQVQYLPGCSPELNEYYVFENFLWEEVDYDIKTGMLKIRGKCNKSKISIYRQTP